MFKYVGPIQDTWRLTYSEWLLQTEYERNQEYEFEKYTKDNNYNITSAKFA